MASRKLAKLDENLLLGTSLTWVAGYVDAVGYLVLAKIYSANMSGNTVGLGIRIAGADWADALTRLLPALAFMPGLLVGMLMVEWSKRRKARAALAPALLFEMLLIGAFILIGVWILGNHGKLESHGRAAFVVLIGLAGGAMGVQNGSLHHVGALKNVHTYVTGTLLAAMDAACAILLWGYDRLKTGRPRRVRRVLRVLGRQKRAREAGFAGMLWFGYLGGGISGAVLLRVMGILALLVAIGVMGVMVGVDWMSPVWVEGK
ncbi:MAG: YoaK family protein [Phycisphaerae bacterium]